MAEDLTTLLIDCRSEDVAELRGLLEGAHAEVQASPERRLDGAVVTSWVVLASVAARSAPAVIDALRRFLTRNNLDTVSVGEITITNPRPEDLPQLLAAISAARQDG
jgi:hypothetical protein